MIGRVLAVPVDEEQRARQQARALAGRKRGGAAAPSQAGAP